MTDQTYIYIYIKEMIFFSLFENKKTKIQPTKKAGTFWPANLFNILF